MINLTNSELKILKYINRHSNCTYSKIYKKHPLFKDCFLKFKHNHLIEADDPNDSLFGKEYADLDNPTIIAIAHDGTVYLESHSWFNFEFLVKDFLIPIAVSIITTLVTLYLTGELSLFQ